MMSIDFVITELGTVRREEIEDWITHQWLRPEQQNGQYVFVAIDIARARLILELREEMAVNDEAIPIILSLLDQLYELRRQIGALGRDFPVSEDQMANWLAKASAKQHLKSQ